MFGPGFSGFELEMEKGILSGVETRESNKLLVRNAMFWGLILGIGFLVLFFRLLYLQIWEGQRNRIMADGQRIRLVQVPAGRGLVVDRNEKILVQNKPIFREVFVDAEKGVMLKSISRDEALLLEAEGFSLNVIEGVGRNYLYGSALAHVLGYVGEVNAEELELGAQLDNGTVLELGDMVGRGGIEQTYDEWLRGKNGALLVEVDTRGRFIRQVGNRQPVAGNRLELTLDIDLQKKAVEALNDKLGAVVVSTVDGQILAMVSSPGYDPEVFDPMNASNVGTADKMFSLFNDESRPLLNRAISAVYAPGSTFKLVTAATALESGAITEHYVYNDTGVVRVGEYEYNNWYLTQYGAVEGEIDLKRALARSTDTFFYKAGEMVGADLLADWSRKFGLGAEIGVDLVGELGGLVPDPEWKVKDRGENWWLGNTYHMAIGQGDLLTTPLQVNFMTGVIASNGKRCRPKLVQKSEVGIQNSECVDIGLRKETIQLIKAGMVGACSPGGTAFPFFDFEPQVACKTGTAEFGSADEHGVRKTHAWLTAFAPVDAPEIVVTVLLESGGEGSKDAAPVAKKVVEAYFKE